MSKLRFNRNIFLEKEELMRFQEFLKNSTVSEVVLENTSNWGIARTVFTGVSPDFLVEVGTNVGTIKIDTLSKAVDKDKLLIKQIPIDNISVPQGVWSWVKISHEYLPYEEGTCSVNANGEVTGLNTLFTDVLRGQATEVPVKIKFYKSSGEVNNQVYEVVEVTNDVNIALSGAGFTEESNLKYIVIGSTPLGETITNSQLEGLYQYDSCKIEFVNEVSLGVAPEGLVEDKEFYIARVRNLAGVVTIEDKRTEFLTFNVEGMTDKLSKNENLADLEDKAEARANLEVMSSQEIAKTYFVDSGWKDLTKGVAASADDFKIMIRRIGKLCIVQGTFKNSPGSTKDSIIASIPYAQLFVEGETVVGVTERISFQIGPQLASSNDENYGLLGYIMSRSVNETHLQLKVDENQGGGFGAKFNINFSFFLG